MQTSETTQTPALQPSTLSPAEADDAWERYRSEVAGCIKGFIATMGLPPSMSNLGSEQLGRAPTPEQIRPLLRHDPDLHAEISDRVERDFRTAAHLGRVEGDKVPGFLNRLTQRATWKLATKRAKHLLATLVPHTDGREVLDAVADLGMSPEELLGRRETLRLCAQVASRLSQADQRVLDAKFTEGGYAALAADWDTTVGALKTRACRVWDSVRREVLDESDGRTAVGPKRSTKRKRT